MGTVRPTRTATMRPKSGSKITRVRCRRSHTEETATADAARPAVGFVGGGPGVFLLIAIFVVSTVSTVGAGLAGYRQGWALPRGGPSGWGRSAAERFGSIPATVGILGLGTAVVSALNLPVGLAAKALEGPIDHPAFRFAQDRVHGGTFTALNEKLTVLGNNGQVQLIILLAGILLASIWGRNWWAPIVLLLASFYLVRYSQRSLAHLVDRGHPPTTNGTFPSGGVARVLALYGLIVVLVLFLLPALSRGWRAGLFTGLAVAAVVEAYTRWYLSKHWLTDALSGLVFGGLMLAVTAAAAAALMYRYIPPGRQNAAAPTESGPAQSADARSFVGAGRRPAGRPRSSARGPEDKSVKIRSSSRAAPPYPGSQAQYRTAGSRRHPWPGEQIHIERQDFGNVRTDGRPAEVVGTRLAGIGSRHRRRPHRRDASPAGADSAI